MSLKSNVVRYRLRRGTGSTPADEGFDLVKDQLGFLGLWPHVGP